MFYERHQHAAKVMRNGGRWSSNQATHVRIWKPRAFAVWITGIEISVV